MMKHTKGPWKTQGTAVWTNAPTIPFLIAEVTKPTSDANGINWKANANLIAAAPCMLEALERLKSDFEISDCECDGTPDGSYACLWHRNEELILKVLKKAKGNNEKSPERLTQDNSQRTNSAEQSNLTYTSLYSVVEYVQAILNSRINANELVPMRTLKHIENIAKEALAKAKGGD